jgi:hydroxymethylbilane synthase
VEEVLVELRLYHLEADFERHFVETTGDLDLQTSLRHLGATDFFTKEVDALVLSGCCQVGIHSAKDLPDPLAEGLKIVALTRGVDPCDVLVLREGMGLDDLKEGALIATSSLRRESACQQLSDKLSFCDIRGTIEARLNQLWQAQVDGVVVAKAALIRLGLELNCIELPGETTPLQGKLAVVAKEGDEAMCALFQAIDSRN